MNHFKLSTIGEVASMYSSDLKSIKTSLIWSKDDDLDLMVFYKTKEGGEGSVYSGDIPGGDFGELDSFPFISCGDSGVDDESDEVVSYEKVYFNDLSSFEKIYFVVTNYAELILKKQINFNEYGGLLKISPTYSDLEKKDRYTMKLSSEERGDLLVLGKLDIGESIILIKNMNKVMTFKEFKEKIPGSKQLTL